MKLLTNLTQIAAIAATNENENDAFRIFLKQQDSGTIDAIVHDINAVVTPQIDCTKCGNCCRSLMINVTPEETLSLALHLNEKIEIVKKKYIEISAEGQMIVNTIPCHFLADSSCTIYENRFTECREFPHLHKENFTGRLFGTLMYYALCPIIFNVVEALKEKLEFKY